MMSTGLSIAVLNSIVNALCDPLRKYMTKYMEPFALVATRGLIQAPLFCVWAFIDNGWKFPSQLNHLFWISVCISGTINIITSYLYNRSIQISTLSATVPFLSFTPAFLLVVGFLVLGEVPSFWGVVGILIAVMGGFWLQISNSMITSASMQSHKEAYQQAQSEGITTTAAVDILLHPSHASKGSMYMIAVSFLWSISNAFDKIGVSNSSPLVYGAFIQVIVAVGSFILHKLRVGENDGLTSHASLGATKDHHEKKRKPSKPIPWRLVFLAGITSVVSYYINLIATQHLEVSYVIAIKRSGCIWSVLLGKLLFQEKNLRQKLPSIFFMVVGVLCIVLTKK